MRGILLMTMASLLLCSLRAACQDHSDPADKTLNFPAKFFGKLNQKAASLSGQLDKKTTQYLNKLAKREDRLRSKIARLDSASAANLPPNQYAILAQKLKSDTARSVALSGEYRPGIDSLNGSLSFLNKNPQLLGANPAIQAKLQQSVTQFNLLQAKMQDADAIKQYVRDRQAQIKQYLLSKFTTMPPGIASQYQGMQQAAYYYSAQIKAYKEALNNPDQLTQKALVLLNRLPAFQNFMKTNGQFGSLFSLPGNYGGPQAIEGLQGKDEVDALLRAQVSSGGASALSTVQQNMQTAQSQLDNFKSKLNALGTGSGDMDMPAFKPDQQKTKTFLKRLQFGTDFQTTPTSYYWPMTTDLGLTVGYKITDRSTIGLGGSFKLGWGNGIQHISLSGQGAGLRSFVDVKIGGSFSLTGGFEYNYQQVINSFRQISNLNAWSQSGLFGVTKTVSTKSTVLKQTKLQLLWDALSYFQHPVTQPFKFRVGYNL